MFRVSAKLAVKTIHGRIVLTMRQRRRCAVYFQKDAFKKNFRKLLQRDGIDARSVQKTPAGTPKTEHPCSILGYKFAGANLILLETADISVRSDTLSIYFVQHEVDAHLQRFCKETVQIQGASKNKAETRPKMNILVQFWAASSHYELASSWNHGHPCPFCYVEHFQ